MLKDRMKSIKKAERLSGFFKDTAVLLLLKTLLREHPQLSQTQCRRIFSHAYQSLRHKDASVVFLKGLNSAIKALGDEFMGGQPMFEEAAAVPKKAYDKLKPWKPVKGYNKAKSFKKKGK